MRMIDADWFKELVLSKKESDPYVVGVMITAIDAMPTVEERKKGKWLEVEVFLDSYDIYGNKTWSIEMQCDQCGFRHTAIEGHMAQYKFCPNCGADMRGEEWTR